MFDLSRNTTSEREKNRKYILIERQDTYENLISNDAENQGNNIKVIKLRFQFFSNKYYEKIETFLVFLLKC